MLTKAESLIRQMLANTDGKFFTVEFVKKNGEYRKLTGRTGVTKHLKGGTLNYNPVEKGLFIVYDVQNQGYRSVALDRIKVLKIDGNTYHVN